jgi:hypothetical protein
MHMVLSKKYFVCYDLGLLADVIFNDRKAFEHSCLDDPGSANHAQSMRGVHGAQNCIGHLLPIA